MVRVVGFEPTSLAASDFESDASANFTTPAYISLTTYYTVAKSSSFNNSLV